MPFTAQCESCGRDFLAKNSTVHQCADHVGQPVVQDEVTRLRTLSDAAIYATKTEATLRLRTLKGDKYANWRTVKACDRILVARELPSVAPDTLTRIKRIVDKRFVYKR